MNVLQKFQKSSKKNFQKKVPKKFQKNSKKIPKKFQKSSKKVAKKFKKTFKKTFKKSSKKVHKKVQKKFKKKFRKFKIFLVRSCLLITLITCLKGHKSLRVLYGSVFQKCLVVSQSVTRPPLELSLSCQRDS